MHPIYLRETEPNINQHKNAKLMLRYSDLHLSRSLNNKFNHILRVLKMESELNDLIEVNKPCDLVLLVLCQSPIVTGRLIVLMHYMQCLLMRLIENIIMYLLCHSK